MLTPRTQHYTPHYHIDVVYLRQIGDTDEWHIRFRSNDFKDVLDDIKYCGGRWHKDACNGKGAWKVSLEWLMARDPNIGTQSEAVYNELCFAAMLYSFQQARKGKAYRPLSVMPAKVKQAFDKLGLPITATEAELKQAKRKLSLKHHPDVGGDMAIMQQINVAYDIVLDYIKRAA